MSTVTAKKFVSARAARLAFGKAERAYEAARKARINEHHERVANGVPARLAEEMAPFEKVENDLRLKAQAIYDVATAQGFFIKSYTFSRHNTTRDLVAVNID